MIDFSIIQFNKEKPDFSEKKNISKLEIQTKFETALPIH
jgi:hypothetical protein